jgi:hypothetical protein
MSVIPRGHRVDTAKPAINYGGRDVDEGGGPMVTRRMGNVLDEEKQLQIVALGAWEGRFDASRRPLACPGKPSGLPACQLEKVLFRQMLPLLAMQQVVLGLSDRSPISRPEHAAL